MYYNFARVHQTLRATPAMEAGIASHVWSVEEIVGLLGDEEKADGDGALFGTQTKRLHTHLRRSAKAAIRRWSSRYLLRM